MIQGLGHVVRERRKQIGHTLAQLAQAVGCSKAYLSAIENDRLANPPSRSVLQQIEAALDIVPGQLVRLADWQRTPAKVRAEISQLEQRSRKMAALLKESTRRHGAGGKDLDQLYQSGELAHLLDSSSANIDQLPAVCYQVPLINEVAAGYPSDFTDLDYPARVADEYVAVPDLTDAQAFAARVVGQSMTPVYRQGDVIVFSPARPVSNGDDCFVRLLPDHHTTFKRIFFEQDDRVRLQPLNPAFAPQIVDLADVSGLYSAVYRLQRLMPLNPSQGST